MAQVVQRYPSEDADMPLKVTLKVGDDEMTVEADAMDATIVDLAKTWVTALPPASPDDAARARQIADVQALVDRNTSDLTDATDPPAA